MIKQWPGSIWWKFDFHNHTPASSDYNQAEKGSLTPREWLVAYMRAEIDCVAITDHNDGSWINDLQAELVNMRDSQPPLEEFRELVLYPGIEITSSEGIHILGIFSPERTIDKISRISALVGLPETAPNAERICSKGAEDVCKEIRGIGGVIVLAHAEDPKGILEPRSRNVTDPYQPIREFRQIEKLIEICDAVETHNTASAPILHFSDKLTSKALVDGSDAHSSSNAGVRYTWIKMSEPSIDGLKLALLDPNSSVLRQEVATRNPNTPPTQRLASLTIEKLYLRRHTPLKLDFSPWLSTIIGGRGSGKSTIIESCRLALSRENEIEALGDIRTSDVCRSFERFKKIRANRNDSGMLTAETVIEAIVEKDGAGITETYRYQWSSDILQISRLNEDENWEDTGLRADQARELFPVKIFSQKQIFEFSDRPRSILEYIDSSLSLDQREWSNTRETLCKHISDLRYRERELLTKLKTKPGLEVEKKEVSRKARVFQQSNFADEVNKYQRHKTSKDALTAYTNNISVQVDNLRAIVNQENPFTSSSLSELPNDIQAGDIASTSNDLTKRLESDYGHIVEKLSEMSLAVNNFKVCSEVSQFNERMDAAISEYRVKVDGLKTEGINSSKDAEDILARQIQIDKILAELVQVEVELEQIQKSIIKAYFRLVRHRKCLSKGRQEFVDSVLEKVPDLRIEVVPFEDLEASVDEFRSALRLQNDRFVDEVLGETESNGNRGGILGKITANNVQTTVHNRIHHLKLGIINQETEILGHQLHGRLQTALQRLDDDDHQNLIEWFPEDLVKIKFRRDSNSPFQPLQSASAGQKTSAILSFILHHGNEPLILDQPEDDLDNGLISSLLVNQLRESKVKRQVIAVTHNANIVVNGDAELVLPMEFSGGQINLSEQGGLQEESVRRKICSVMEGGETAFRQRYKRILEDLDVRN